ncbi:BPSL0067 family protein [Sphingomonas sp. PB4P5]|uniref:BPSL0067 family protein n=1 Tax=Parasphingomonas puruogangriensis TaxID=3096155 RepID=UPI002FCA9FDE
MPQTISRGKSGPVVRELQQNLRRRGAHLKPDSLFGPETEKAVRNFQTGAHLPPDGVVGPRTWNALHGVARPPRQAPERPIYRDWSFEQMLRDTGAWIEEHNPFGGNGSSLPAPRPRLAAPRAPRPATGGSAAPTVVTGTDGGRFQRIGFDGYDGRAWVIKNFTDLKGKQIREFRNGTFAVNPVGAPRFGISECVHLVKYFGVPYTGTWRRGPQVCHFKPGELPVGTVIATLRDNVYHSDYSGRSHVGIYLGHDDYGAFIASRSKTAGVRMSNQWNGQVVQDSTKAYAVEADAYGGASRKAWNINGTMVKNRLSWTKDGEEYFVVMTK